MIDLVGHDVEVPCADGSHRRYRSFDTAASTSALPAVAEAVTDFLPWYSSVHRGAGFKSQRATQAYELAVAGLLVLGVPIHQPTRLTRNPVESFTTIDRHDGPPLRP
jgi:hypothetical protein